MQTTLHSIPSTRYRIASIDLLRGLVMIIMALDHTRDYFHESAMTADPLGPDATPALFFTRWITHFCAPVFVLLSGISAYLSSQHKTPAQTSSFLLKRGLWLILMELTIVNFGLSFNPFFNFVILQVIWAIGWSMIILALLSRLSFNLSWIVGILLIIGHNLTDILPTPENRTAAYILQLFVSARGTVIPINNTHFIGAFYAILPWTGIMLIGYGMGKWFSQKTDAEVRRKRLLLTGLIMTVVFIALRLIRSYGDPAVWDGSGFLSFLNTSKYPASLQFTCMILGPALILLALLEKATGSWTRIPTIYGKVPFFYFVVHFYLLHLLLVVIFFTTGHSMNDIADPQSIFLFRPRLFGFSLPVVYMIWIAVVCAMYHPCRWFYTYKTTHSQWWLKYI